MCSPETASTMTLALGATNTAMAAVGAFSNAKTQKITAQSNAALARIQSQDALSRGEKAVNIQQQKAAQVKSSQRVALAANGLDLNYGTALDLLTSTDYTTQLEAESIRENARREALGAELQGLGYDTQARINNPWATGLTTFASGATDVAAKWYSLKKAGAR